MGKRLQAAKVPENSALTACGRVFSCDARLRKQGGPALLCCRNSPEESPAEARESWTSFPRHRVCRGKRFPARFDRFGNGRAARILLSALRPVWQARYPVSTSRGPQPGSCGEKKKTGPSDGEWPLSLAPQGMQPQVDKLPTAGFLPFCEKSGKLCPAA